MLTLFIVGGDNEKNSGGDNGGAGTFEEAAAAGVEDDDAAASCGESDSIISPSNFLGCGDRGDLQSSFSSLTKEEKKQTIHSFSHESNQSYF